MYRDLRIRTNRFKLTAKARIREELMRDRGVLDAIVDWSHETGLPLLETERRARLYLDEIIPAFDLVSYYRIGLPIARAALRTLYRLVAWKDDLPEPRRLHAENAVVYIFNHRSNADYLVAAWALTDRVALSYAVGEWARVWPLEGLFKSFGSYFVRRGCKEALYHRILGRYVQLITRRGVPQAIFLEGGLSRDGRMREPKIGLLDHILQCVRDPDFSRDVVFVPGSINYDRVLEDRALTREAAGRRAEVSLLRMFRRTLDTLFRGTIKLALRRLRKHGAAAIRLGRPISFREHLARAGREAVDLGREERAPHVLAFARRLMDEVARLVPAASVPVTALALAEERGSISLEELSDRVGGLRAALEAGGARLVDHTKSSPEIAAQAAILLETRRILAREPDGRLRVNEPDREILRYYARSIEHLLGKADPPPEAAVASES